MPSRADRQLAERALRAIALLALTVLAVRLWRGSETSAERGTVPVRALDSALVAWSLSSPGRAELVADRLPDPTQRDWLVALRRTGLDLGWQARDTAGVAVVAQPRVRPHGAVAVAALGSGSAPLVLADALGLLDSASARRTASWHVAPVGPVAVTSGAVRAVAEPRDSLSTRAVLVVGTAGWEAKFVTAALEEAGWDVATRIAVAPGAIVRQGSSAGIDTATLSAVVVLDSASAIDAAALGRFLHGGGGVVASGPGVRHPALRAWLPAAGAMSPAVIGGLSGPTPRLGLGARTFRLAGNAVPVERRGDGPVVVGKRVGPGRVVAVGYDDTWRLRMAVPDESAPQAHRDWWSSLVGSVALVRLHPRPLVLVDEAPLANTVRALGPPAGTGASSGAGRNVPWTALLTMLAAASLLAEWLSRRLRGAP